MSDDKTCQMNFDSSSRDFFSQQRQIQSQLLDEEPQSNTSINMKSMEQKSKERALYMEEERLRMTSPKD